MFEDMTERNELEQICSILKECEGNIYIQMHNNPDPDSLGAGNALRYLLKEKGFNSILCYSGEISKANITKMLELFSIEPININQIEHIDAEEDYLILIDCQRQSGNVYDIGIENVLCIDHHKDYNKEYLFSDIRSEIGACSTIISEYFIENDIKIPSKIAGALLYGMDIDTNYLERGAARLDKDIFYVLVNTADPKDIAKINQSQISIQDIKYYAEGLKSVEKYENIAFANVNNCNDALLGTISDLIHTVDGVEIIIVYSIRENGIKFSVRSSNDEVAANSLIEYLLKDIGSGGGHREMAGGFLAKDGIEKLGTENISDYVKRRVTSFRTYI